MQLIRLHGPKALPRSAAMAFLLAVALLCVQWVGMLHRIDHAAGQGDPPVQAKAHGLPDDWSYSKSSISHSCVVFDGAYLADLLPTTLVAIIKTRMVQVLLPAIDFLSWSGLFFSHFLPRGPPAA